MRIVGVGDYRSTIRGFVNQKWVPYSQRYLFNAIPDTNHNANPTNPNTRYRIIEPSDYRYITALGSSGGHGEKKEMDGEGRE